MPIEIYWEKQKEDIVIKTVNNSILEFGYFGKRQNFLAFFFFLFVEKLYLCSKFNAKY